MNILPAQRRAKFYLGIDPGVHNGFAVWQPLPTRKRGQYVSVTTLTHLQLVKGLQAYVAEHGAENLRVRIENPSGNRPTFDKQVVGSAKREKVSQNVGSNKRDYQIIVAWLEDLGIPYDAITPGKKSVTKPGDAYFIGQLGWPPSTSQHARDAAALVIGF